MSTNPTNPHQTPGIPDTRPDVAQEPVTDDDTATPPDDSPDAFGSPEIDEVRANEVDESTTEDSYEMRSMPTDPHGSDDDPASFVNP